MGPFGLYIGLLILASIVLTMEYFGALKLGKGFIKAGIPVYKAEVSLPSPEIKGEVPRGVIKLENVHFTFPDLTSCLFVTREKISFFRRRHMPFKGLIEWRDSGARITMIFPLGYILLMVAVLALIYFTFSIEGGGGEASFLLILVPFAFLGSYIWCVFHEKKKIPQIIEDIKARL